jgi:WD40 repeat protein
MADESLYIDNIIQFASDERDKGNVEEAIALLRDALLWPQSQDPIGALLARWGISYLDSFMGGHSEDIIKLLVNSKGTILVSLSIKGIIKIWDAETLNELKTLHIPHVGGLSLSPDGQYLAVTTEYIHADIYETGDFKLVSRFTVGHVDDEEAYEAFPVIYSVSSISFSPDNSLIAFGVGSDFVKIFRFPEGGKLADIPVNSTTIINVLFSPNGQYLAYNEGTMLKVLDAGNSWSLVSTLKSKSYSFSDFVWNGASTRLYALSHKTLYGYNVKKKNLEKSMALDMESPRSLALSPVTKALAVIDTEGVKMFRARTLKEIASYKGRIFIFHPREKQAYLSEEEGVISTIDLSDNKTLAMSIKHHTISCVSLVLRSGVAAVGLSDRVVLWDLAAKKRLKTHTLNPFGDVSSVIPDPAGTCLYCSTQYGYKTVNLDTLEVEKAVKVIKIELEGQARGNVAFSRSGGKVAYASFGRIAVYPVSSHDPEVTLECDEGIVTSLGFFNDPDLLYTVINDYYTLVWDLKAQKSLGNLYGAIIGLIDNGDMFLLYNRSQQELEVRRSSDRSVILDTIPIPLTCPASRMILSPDAATMACAAGKTVILWDLDREKEITTVYGHSGNVITLSFSHDGKFLVSNSQYEAMITDLARYTRQMASLKPASTCT